MKTRKYKYLELLMIALLIISFFLPWMRIFGETMSYWYDYTLSGTTIIVYSLCVGDMVYPAWGIIVALVLLIPEVMIQKRFAEEEKNERRRAIM